MRDRVELTRCRWRGSLRALESAHVGHATGPGQRNRSPFAGNLLVQGRVRGDAVAPCHLRTRIHEGQQGDEVTDISLRHGRTSPARPFKATSTSCCCGRSKVPPGSSQNAKGSVRPKRFLVCRFGSDCVIVTTIKSSFSSLTYFLKTNPRAGGVGLIGARSTDTSRISSLDSFFEELCQMKMSQLPMVMQKRLATRHDVQPKLFHVRSQRTPGMLAKADDQTTLEHKYLLVAKSWRDPSYIASTYL
jgi:hypothetical protein